jgi:hypothetical protein
VPPGPEQRLLRAVLGRAGIARDREGETVDAALEAADERRGGVGIAGSHAGQQRVVGNSPHGDLRRGRPQGLDKVGQTPAPMTVSRNPIRLAARTTRRDPMPGGA